MRHSAWWLAPMILLAAGSLAQGRGHGCGPGCGSSCGSASCGPQYQLVQKTVMVPTWTTQMRTVYVTQCVPEQRHKTITVQRQVPVMRQVTKSYTVLVPEQRTRTVEYPVCRTVWEERQQEYTVNVPYQETRQAVRYACQWVDAEVTRTVMVPEVRTKTINYTVCKPVWREETREYTVNVPYQETRQGVRQVCHRVPVHQTRTIRVDQGCWQTVTYEVPSCGGNGCGACGHGGCAPRHVCRRVWAPNYVEKQIHYTTYKNEVQEVPYEYQVTLCRPENAHRHGPRLRHGAGAAKQGSAVHGVRPQGGNGHGQEAAARRGAV